MMAAMRAGYVKRVPISVIVIVLFLVAGLGVVVFKTQFFQSKAANGGLSGLVSVRGSVSLEQLNLTSQEVRSINKAVNEYRDTFTKVDLIVDVSGPAEDITDSTVLIFAVSLETNEDLVIKSWSRKIQRGGMVTQLISYVRKAAGEYEEFKHYPDVKQKFKTLYI